MNTINAISMKDFMAQSGVEVAIEFASDDLCDWDNPPGHDGPFYTLAVTLWREGQPGEVNRAIRSNVGAVRGEQALNLFQLQVCNTVACGNLENWIAQGHNPDEYTRCVAETRAIERVMGEWFSVFISQVYRVWEGQ